MGYGYRVMVKKNVSIKKIFFPVNYSLLLITFFISTNAYALDLGMPISCNYGKDCFISNYFDHDAVVGSIKDRSCGPISHDGYKSTDFILKNVPQMKAGVNVLAGDTGVIKYVRNDIEDVNVDLSGLETVKGHECGNGILIEHTRGYETQYCHLKKDSITLKRGDKVEKGDIMGQVGLSGLTNFPYLEFTVFMNGKALDPFTGEDPVTGKAEVACDSLDIYPLWDRQSEKTLTYINTAILSIGFSSKVPNALGARNGRYSSSTITNDSKLISFWIDIFGMLKGDKLKMSIISSEGEEIYTETKTVSADKRHLFQFIGTKLSDNKLKWKNGEYIGKATLLRGDASKSGTVFDTRAIVEVVDPTPEKK